MFDISVIKNIEEDFDGISHMQVWVIKQLAKLYKVEFLVSADGVEVVK